MENIRISIIMPVYNAELNLNSAIKSVINQSYDNWELIIVDDESSDHSNEICNKWSELDKRIKVYTQSNMGPSGARNNGLNIAKGEYIVFIDADDEYEITYLEEMIKFMNENTLVCCDFNKIIDGKQINRKNTNKVEKLNIKDFINTTMNKRNFNVVWNKMYSKKIIRDYQIKFNNEISYGEDMEFNIEYLKYIENAYYIDKCLYKYKISKSSLSYKERINDFEIRIHNVDCLHQLYNIKKYNTSECDEKYIEAFIQNAMLVLNKYRKDESYDIIKKNVELLYNKIEMNSKVAFETKLYSYFIRNKKYKILINCLKLRLYLKKIMKKI